MKVIRKSEDRGLAQHGWLTSRHTFSFADYFDEKQMGFSVLRVINEDQIQGGTGFGLHGHSDMEIISYVIEGALAHKDSMGTDTVIRPGEVQRMSAGTGVKHSEMNHSKDKIAHFLQIWILPEKKSISPGYGQRSFSSEFAKGELVLVVSKAGRDGSISINQDIDMFACKSHSAGAKRVQTTSKRSWWLQVISGSVEVDSEKLNPGDGAGLKGIDSFQLKWNPDSEFILFDLP